PLESLKNPNRTIIIATHNPLIWEQVDQVIRVTDLSHR
ncbi:MAG: ABC transporter ATP-binding protein, partial [Streptococcus mitis]|nr:ABC transporter ATP-binding protein [Streptococcus mitis]